ncbi:MAG: ribonuclease E/G, partial [Pseudomonadota bacterium]|nr:ribonuclease E/G [Pseudomonadota bacterium]
EALVAIDINSGKSTKEGSIEDTALKTNLEAADEIARQLRLRDLAGLIVIDFIDMEDPRNNRAVEKRMKEKLKIDRARIQVGRISAFGLMEMSRQRLRPGVLEATTAPCAHCHGTGIVRADSSLALAILRQLEGEAARARAPELLVHAPMGAAAYLLNDKRENLSAIEAQHGVVVRVQPDPALFSPEFHIEKVKTQTRKPTQVAAVTALSVAPPDLEDYDQIEEAEIVEAEATEAEAPEAEAKPEPEATPATRARADSAEDGAEDDDASRRRRGRRGGRRRRRGPRDEDAAEDVTTGTPEAAEPAEAGAVEAAGTEAEESDQGTEPVDAAIPAPRRTRRRRKPRADAAEPATETPAPTETTAAVAPAETADAAPAAEAGPTDAPTPLPEPAPEPAAEAVAAETAGAEPQPDAPGADAGDVAEQPEQDASELQAEPVPEDLSAEAPAPAPSPSPEMAEATSGSEPAPADDARPKKRGWWAFNR